MAGEKTYGTPLKIVDINNVLYELLPKYIQDGNGEAKTWADIEAAAAEAGIALVSLNALPTIPADQDEAAALYATYRKTLVFVPSSNPKTQNTKDEYIIQRVGTEGSYTYSWEQIGSTELDLTNYVQKGVTYTNAALDDGAHTHTVTVPTVSVGKTLKLGATITDTVVSSTKKYLATTTVTGVSGSTTASKATAGTDFNAVKTVSISSNDETATGRVPYISGVSAPSLGGTTSFNTDAIKDITLSAGTTSTDGPQYLQDVSHTAASLTGTTTFATGGMIASVTDGVLSFTSASTGTVGISGGSITKTTKYMKHENTAASKNSVTISGGTGTTKYLAVGTTTQSVTPYTFENVTVPKAATEATTVATGAITATGTSGNEVVTDVSVSTQPTITITESENNAGPVNEHITVGTATATTSSDGAHTHDINVPE